MYNDEYGKGFDMDNVSYTSFRANLAHMLDKVNRDHAPLMITRQNGKPAIVMSVEDFKSYEETAYLMASPGNAARLNEAISEIESGKSSRHELIEE
jgi:antitoxin YefM